MLAEIRIEQSMDGAIQLLELALACVGDDYAHAAQLEVANGVIRIAVLDLRRAAAHLARAVELAERSKDTALLAEAIALNELARLFSGLGVDEGALLRALALEDADRVVPFQMRPSINVAQTYEFIGRLGEARQIFVTLFERITARGEEADLAWVLIHLTQTSWLAGNFALAEDEADQALRAATLTGQDLFVAFALLLRSMIRALRGDRGRARSDGIEAMAASERIGWAIGVGQSRFGLGFLALSDGDPREALAFLEPVVASTEALGVYEWVTAMEVPDAVEALVATGDVERAERLTDALSAWGRDYDRPWALATSGRCRALLEAAAGHLDAACAAAERALIEHQRLPMPFERGRTQLVLGQLQRRRGERRVARETLQRALATFEVLEAPLWAENARNEISRIGVRRAPDHLTEGERRVAELAAQGMTNRDIGLTLFLSRRTVEANLARVYRKLDIRSRAELGAVWQSLNVETTDANPPSPNVASAT